MYGTNPNQLTIGVMNLYFKRTADTKYYDIGSLRDSSFAYGVEVKEHASVLPASTVMARDKVVVISKSAAVRGTAEQLNVQNLALVMGGATVSGQYTAITGTTNVSGGRVPLGETTSVEEVECVGVHRFPDGYYLNLRFWKTNAAGAFELPFNQSDWVGYPIELKALADYTNHSTEPFGYIDISNTPFITGAGMVY